MKIRKYLKSMEKVSYSDSPFVLKEGMMDCSLGCNSYGFPPAVFDTYKNFDVGLLSHYPHSHALEEKLGEHWGPKSNLSHKSILLTDGSISAIYSVVNLFAEEGATFIAPAPTFCDFVQNAQLNGMVCRPIQLKKEDNYKISIEQFIEATTPDLSFVYMDNANNPTGQVIPLADLDRLIAHAAEMEVAVIIDEAYGGFITKEESAINLLHKYDNLLVLRTFSKGLGLAGLRAGYIATSEYLLDSLAKISNPYCIGEVARELTATALENYNFILEHMPDYIKSKEMLRAALTDNLSMAVTDDRIPICTLTHKDPNANLQQIFYDNNILTVSGSDFGGLTAASVRLRVPVLDEMDILLAAVKKI